MTAPLALLSYAGRKPTPRRSLLARCCGAIGRVVIAALFAAFLAVRAALLTAGFACVFAGLLLLTLGGKRDAARRLMAWRERVVDLCRLWGDDIVRVLRRRRAPRPVLPVTSVTSR